MKFTDEEAKESTLQELMDAMGKMDAQRMKKPGAADVTIQIAGRPKSPEDAFEQNFSGGPGTEFENMDPRLQEILRRKRGG